jgi:two-component system chemotaxis sensor kinase CheA
VSDDGRGIDANRVKAKAIANGMTTEADVARMSEEQILRFVMEPGFSTAAKITNISGRGVGLDVVRSHVEQVGGSVDLRSRAGKGLSVTIKLPLTLAIASALIVEVAGQRFAIPQIAVAELVRTQNDGDVRIEKLNGQATLRLRQRLLPVLDVADVLNLPVDVAARKDADSGLVVVCQVGTTRFGMVVDAIHQTEEIVVKPISSKLRHMSVYSGATILGDGSVILILEPAGVARGILETASREAVAQNDNDLAAELHQGERSLLLLFRAGGGGGLKAIPLAFIGRLEEFERGRIEDAGGRAVTQYRGKLMPILGYSGMDGLEPESRQPVLVFHQQDREIGMAVDEIVDVVEAALTIDTTHATPGTVGAAIIDGRAVDIIDVSELVAPEQPAETSSGSGPDVLVVESSEFFRAMFAPLLQNAGYTIHVVPSLAAARLNMVRGKPGVIVLDLDQPGEEAFTFVKELADDMVRPPAVVGAVTRGGPRVIHKAKGAGLHDLVGKFDRQGLLAAIGEARSGLQQGWEAAA